jgi:hypothetical protein
MNTLNFNSSFVHSLARRDDTATDSIINALSKKKQEQPIVVQQYNKEDMDRLEDFCRQNGLFVGGLLAKLPPDKILAMLSGKTNVNESLKKTLLKG